MNKRVDYLGSECDLGGLSIPDFQEVFCARCTQPECTRSRDGQSRFDQRVRSWEERLFNNVPRLNEKDPRFAHITSKKFLTLDTGPVPSVRTAGASAWVDPREVQEPVAPVVSTPLAVPSAETAPAAPAPPATSAPTRRLPQMNTPNQGGILIGSPPPSSGPVKDPWAGPVPSSSTKPTETVIKPGTKVKVGV